MTTSAGSRPTTVIHTTPNRFAIGLLSIAVSGLAWMSPVEGQSSAGQTMQPAPQKPSAAIPATPATSSPLPKPADESPKAPAQHLDVQFTDGKISVEASNASLNQVLREVASKAGIKLTGSVNDDLVFGHYGPSPASAILAMLLDGTGTNMLLVDDARGASELVLTPRRGSPTPPSPNATLDTPAEEGAAASRYVPPIRPFQPPYQGNRSNQIPPPLPPQTDSTQVGTDPNSTRQIYDQLQKAQQGATQDGATLPQTPQQ